MASGPSMSSSVAEVVRASGHDSIVINSTYKLAPWASMLYACDAGWWFYHAQEALKFQGLKVTQSDCVPFKSVMCVKSTGTEGFDDNPSCIRTGMNSAYQAVHIAVHAGAKRILLCGVDMHGVNWHGPHPSPLRNTKQTGFDLMLKYWGTLAPELSGRGVEVINCSLDSALDVFPKARLECSII